MKTKFSFLFVVFLGLSNTFNTAYSQIAISNVAEIPKIKLGTLFVAMKDPNSIKDKEYVAVFIKNWTFSKIECIKYSDLEKNIAINNSFLTIGASSSGIESVVGTSADNSKTNVFLELWTTNGNFVYDPKKRKHFNLNDKIQIARLELFTDNFASSSPSMLYKMDFDAKGHIKNWGTGIITNYIQMLTAYLNKAQEHASNTEIINKQEVQKLNTQTLFIPDYVLTKFNKSTGDETKMFDEKEIFEDYKLGYKLISIADLNTKIVSDTTPFYYIIYIKSGNDKYINVVNSITGEIIYSAFTSQSYNFKSGDLKDLQKVVQKK